MKKIFSLLLLNFAFFLLPIGSYAQKIAYLNFEKFMSSLPEIKLAQDSLEVFQKRLQEKGQNLVSLYQNKVSSFQKQQQLGELSPKQIEEESLKFKEEQQRLIEFEENMISQINNKSDELLRPIRERVIEAIKQIAKEKGYSYVFNSQEKTLLGGVLPIKDEKNDIEPLLRIKFGLK